MSILIAMLIGILVGLAIGWVFRDSAELRVTYGVVGMAGSLLGLGLYFLSASADIMTLFDPVAILFEVISAILFAIAFRAMHKKAPDSY